MTTKNTLLSHLRPADPKDAHTLPASLYVDPDILNIEYETIFENTWQLIGHIDQVKNPGDQLVCQVGKIPVVVVRNQEKTLKAFHNVCRHRAGPVAIENNNSKVLRCRYHGWTYTLDGQLKSAPEMNSTPNFEVCQFHLPQLLLREWQGFIFVCAGDSPAPFEQVFASISENIQPIDLSEMSFSHRDEYVIECNWKVYMDNYLEGYHLPHVHPGLNKLLDYRSYDTLLQPWYSYQFSPLDDNSNGENFYGEGKAHYYCIYPNLMLNILPGRLQTNIILPLDHQKTRIIFDYYYSDPSSKQTKQLIEQDREFSDVVQDEDIAICEKVQLGLNSGSYHTGRLCMKRETGVLHFQNLIRQSLRDAIEGEQLKDY
ncbi:aromatic ring-hydroxylating oxygenase subunit alpha [Aliikangiella coralliicola]|uniref:Aromatic ring-hydroxylating dioxygenase subunit alpha n=1 Tax=Aliikangiella coralliicola TaxID=2592383 RepID=A0A545TS18_9GAMM|nr:aromatic ring-hydroxylating dioxygenase subunit alpha [Aliikangiella coralliicola]TQV80014.1 aromatic ring-hydroxylating dioxygenase subunit alpha [Aliikangiella coralliicola]